VVDAIGAAAGGLAAAGTWMDATAVNIANALLPVPAPGSGPAAAMGNAFSNVDLAAEMPNLLLAAVSYEANLAVISRAQSAYQSLLDLVQPAP
jgi:flagellar basal body rod protein FlgC